MKIVCGPAGVRECDFAVSSSLKTASAPEDMTHADNFDPTERQAAQHLHDATVWLVKFFRGERARLPRLDIQGSELEVAVWSALLKIDYGLTATYQDVAKIIGKPRAVRSVASAVGRNKLALFVPCHRVVPKHPRYDQPYGEYAAGAWRKEVLLKLEAQGEKFAKNSWPERLAARVPTIDTTAALV